MLTSRPLCPCSMSNRAVPILPLTLLAISLCATACLSLAVTPGRPIAAVFSPWWTPAKIFGATAAAGGDIVRMGAFPNIVVTAAGAPDLAKGSLR